MKKILFVALVFALFVSAVPAQTKKIGMKRAVAIARTRAPGLKVKAKELEREGGRWIYSIEFRNRDGSIREVNVNAYSGKIIAVEHETR